jgi:hypothetical protein
MPQHIFATKNETFPFFPVGRVSAHRLAGESPEYENAPRALLENSDYIKGCLIEHSVTLVPEDVAAIISILADHSSYGERGRGSRCFFPGLALTFADEARTVDVLVCLECSWVVFYSAFGEQWLVPSQSGEKRLRSIYEKFVCRA